MPSVSSKHSTSSPTPTEPTPTEPTPTPGIFQVARRSIVLDRDGHSMKVKKDRKLEINKKEYWEVQIKTVPHQYDSWDLFLDEEQTKAWTVNANQGSADGYFMGQLDFRRLGMKDKFFRRHGTLNTVYIRK